MHLDQAKDDTCTLSAFLTITDVSHATEATQNENPFSGGLSCALWVCCINLYDNNLKNGGCMSSITLPASLTIQSVAADHKDLSERITEIEASVQIDASAVEEIDTAGMQLLLALVNEFNTQSVKAEWQSPSEVLIQTASILGMSEALALPKAA